MEAVSATNATHAQDFSRSIVLQAFQRHSGWDVMDISGQDGLASTASTASHFHWGEYEGIDWERVYSGKPGCSHSKNSLAKAIAQSRLIKINSLRKVRAVVRRLTAVSVNQCSP